MAYTKTNWVNDQTELNAENMNHIEDGIYNSQNVEIIAISDTAPTSCVTGDKYYNTTDNLIYTATGTNTWSEDGEEPIRDVFYILFSEQSSYSYDGTTLVSVGGGTEDIVISDEEPTEEGVKIWIDTGEISDRASEITNSYSTSTGIGYSANYVNNLFQPVQLWSGTKYAANDTLTLSENLQSGHLYMIVCKGVSGTFTVTLPFVYIGDALIQVAYANVAGSTPEGFRYRLMVSGTTITIDSNSQGNNANSAILRVYKIM